jgi:hypothetical protein
MEIDPLIFLAAHAPAEIPVWFQHAPPPNRPVEPPRLDSFEPGTKDRDDAEQAHEGFLPDDASEAVLAWSKAWEDYRAADSDWREKDAMNRYFQWRLMYAQNTAQILSAAKKWPPL